jgi:hypothetical protein
LDQPNSRLSVLHIHFGENYQKLYQQLSLFPALVEDSITCAYIACGLEIDALGTPAPILSHLSRLHLEFEGTCGSLRPLCELLQHTPCLTELVLSNFAPHDLTFLCEHYHEAHRTLPLLAPAPDSGPELRLRLLIPGPINPEHVDLYREHHISFDTLDIHVLTYGWPSQYEILWTQRLDDVLKQISITQEHSITHLVLIGCLVRAAGLEEWVRVQVQSGRIMNMVEFVGCGDVDGPTIADYRVLKGSGVVKNMV